MGLEFKPDLRSTTYDLRATAYLICQPLSGAGVGVGLGFTGGASRQRIARSTSVARAAIATLAHGAQLGGGGGRGREDC